MSHYSEREESTDAFKVLEDYGKSSEDEEEYDGIIVDPEPYDFEKIHHLGELNDFYKLDRVETIQFDGEYCVKFIKNPKDDVDYTDENIPVQAVFFQGRVLYKADLDDENIFELIDLFIRYTHDKCEDVDLEKIDKKVVMRGGTICPTKKHIFNYRGREFIAYGRYIFGYDRQYVKIKNTRGNFTYKLENPPYGKDLNDYVYAFMIKNNSTGLLEAFGLYR